MRALLLAMCSACTGGQTGVPVRDELRVDAGECHPDAATLDFGASELRAKYEGSYTFSAPGHAFDAGLYAGELAARTFTLTVSRSDAQVDWADSYCAPLVLPAHVSVRSADPALDVSLPGVILGTPEHGGVSFPPLGVDAGLPIHVYGNIVFEPGHAPWFYLDVGEEHWHMPALGRPEELDAGVGAR
jgi:hypothetical protein